MNSKVCALRNQLKQEEVFLRIPVRLLALALSAFDGHHLQTSYAVKLCARGCY